MAMRMTTNNMFFDKILIYCEYYVYSCGLKILQQAICAPNMCISFCECHKTIIFSSKNVNKFSINRCKCKYQARFLAKYIYKKVNSRCYSRNCRVWLLSVMRLVNFMFTDYRSAIRLHNTLHFVFAFFVQNIPFSYGFWVNLVVIKVKRDAVLTIILASYSCELL